MARCDGLPTRRFFPEEVAKPGSKAHAVEVQTLREEFCWQCPVRVACFDYALSSPDSRDYGVWAGTTPADRNSFLVVRCECGRTIDPFDLVRRTSSSCRLCQARGKVNP
jgi:hypothetical protein